MSYLVLARKYRPDGFDDIVGQEHVVRTLKNAIQLGRVHHAFLFTGARGVGKTTTARVLARALNCERGPTVTPCGTCAACTEIRQGTSPDVFEIDGASNTGVDNVRELRENVRYLPSKGRIKLYIIDEVHMLSQAAFNALLKTLEEPPPHVKFIFATTEPHKIPVTILSRCQRFDFRRVSNQGLAEHLRAILSKEKVELSAGALAAVVREAQGSVRDALSLLDQVLSYAGLAPADAQVIEALGVVDRQTVFELAGAILGRDAERLLAGLAEVDARGHDLGELAGLLVEHLRDLMVAKLVNEPSQALLERSPGEVEQLKGQASGVSRAELHRLFRLAVKVADDVSRSPQARVSLEMGLLRLLEVEPALGLGELVQKVDTLLQGAPAVSAGVPVSGVRLPRDAAPPAPPIAKEVKASAAEAPSSGDLESAVGWTRLVDRVRSKKPLMASVLEHGRPVRFGPDGVEVGYARGSFYWDQARDEDMKALMGEVLLEHFGQAVTFSLVALDGAVAPSAAPESMATTAETRRRVQDEATRDRARNHPMVQATLNTFNGEIKQVTPLNRENEDQT